MLCTDSVVSVASFSVNIGFCGVNHVYGFFFFKQKTSYEIRISDWSSVVCSSDLPVHPAALQQSDHQLHQSVSKPGDGFPAHSAHSATDGVDRKSVVSGKSVSVRVDLGGRRIIKKHR